MKKGRKVKITLKSLSAAPGEVPDIIELMTEGELYPVTDENGRHGWAVSYEESDVTGFEGSTAVVTCYGDDLASMVRKGNAEANLIIERNRKHHCHYSTEYGSMLIGVYTHRIINRLGDDGGELYFKYTIDANSVLLTDNEVYLEITPIE